MSTGNATNTFLKFKIVDRVLTYLPTYLPSYMEAEEEANKEKSKEETRLKGSDYLNFRRPQ